MSQAVQDLIGDWWSEPEEAPPPPPKIKKHEVAWAPQAGSQVIFLTCPIFEVLYHSGRGAGKTDSLLMDFAQHVGKGFGVEWRGIIFRKTFPDLEDIINKSLKWFPLIFGESCTYNQTKHVWTWNTGEKLYFAQFERETDYNKYHGHAYPFIGWEELTTYPDDKCYKVMMSCCRSTHPDVPRKYRATTNPSGVGHHWVKLRFNLPGMDGKIISGAANDNGDVDPDRLAIRGFLQENKALMEADPNYLQKILASARSASERKAWKTGSWDIVTGGMFDDVWDPDVHILPNFKIPNTWPIYRSFDWGSSKPFSVGWWAISDGCDVVMPDGSIFSTIPGDRFRIYEWYGCVPFKANKGLVLTNKQITAGIIEREKEWGIYGYVRKGPADGSIFSRHGGETIAEQMAAAVVLKDNKKVPGIRWFAADKSKGSRVAGWQQIRQLLQGAIVKKGRAREEKGVYVLQRCVDFVRLLPVSPRDPKNSDDIDSDSEDHLQDEVKYFLTWQPSFVSQGRTRGLF